MLSSDLQGHQAHFVNEHIYTQRQKAHALNIYSGIIILGVAENYFSIYSISSVFSLVLQCIVGPGDFCMFLWNIDKNMGGFLKSLWGGANKPVC